MTKADKLRLCDLLLLPATILMLASSIQLEATGGRSEAWVWVHVILGALFFTAITWHLYLHFGFKSWLVRLRALKSRVTRWLALFAALTLFTGIAAGIHWISSGIHTPLGAVHGKIGFVMIAIAIGHTIKRARFYKAKKRK